MLKDSDKFQLPETTSEDFSALPLDSAKKILGMRYDFASDVFFFQPCKEKVNRVVRNKREMLKTIAAVFDPMGYIGPFVIKGRMLFQRAVKAIKGWDDSDVLPDNLLKEFGVWQQRIEDLSSLRIPRWTTTESCEDGISELHLFADASQEAWGAVAYRRTVGPMGDIHVAIVFSKAHVVPLKVAEAAHHRTLPFKSSPEVVGCPG